MNVWRRGTFAAWQKNIGWSGEVWLYWFVWQKMVHVTDWNCEAPRCRKTTPQEGDRTCDQRRLLLAKVAVFRQSLNAVFQDLWGHRFEFDKDYVWIDSSSCISDCLIIEFFKWISSRILCEDSQACYFPSHYSGNTEATTKRVMGERVRKDSVKRYWGEWEKWDIHVLKGEAKENLDARGS